MVFTLFGGCNGAGTGRTDRHLMGDKWTFKGLDLSSGSKNYADKPTEDMGQCPPDGGTRRDTPKLPFCPHPVDTGIYVTNGNNCHWRPPVPPPPPNPQLVNEAPALFPTWTPFNISCAELRLKANTRAIHVRRGVSPFPVSCRSPDTCARLFLEKANKCKSSSVSRHRLRRNHNVLR